MPSPNYIEPNETHYNVRAAVPDFEADTARWEERSAHTRDTLNGILDIAYGTEPGTRLDLFLAGTADAPLHVFIHGGYWQARDKSDFSFVATPFVAADINVAIVNYDLCPAVTLAHIVEQMREVLMWLWHNGHQYSLDASNIQISGHSAGGHLVAMLMATDWQNCDPALPQDFISSAISISGLFDLTKLVGTSINDKVGLDNATAEDLSPIKMAPRQKCPLILAVGTLESAGFHWQSDALNTAWSADLPEVTRINLPACNHLSAVECLADPTHELFKRALELAQR